MPVTNTPRALMVGGMDVCTVFRMDLETWESQPPEPKTVYVDVPGADGSIDLTDALTGDVAFSDRTMSFTLRGTGSAASFEGVKTSISNALHGRDFDFSLGWDPGYIYHGRFSVSEWGSQDDAPERRAVLSVRADPYKSKGVVALRVNASGGAVVTLHSGRRPVRPVVESAEAIRVGVPGKVPTFSVPAGTHRLNDVVLHSGANELYVSSRDPQTLRWRELAEGEDHAATWESLSGLRWFEWMDSGRDPESAASWESLSGLRWSEVADVPWHRYYQTDPAAPDTTVFITYKWEDL